MTEGQTGVLVLVATPIGNLGDLSARAREELAGANVVACEDTRRTGRLYELAGIAPRPPFLVVNDHTEGPQSAEIVARLQRGDRVAVVTDAGLPGVADPGEVLVRAAVAAGARVEVVPGPSAGVTALVASGLAHGRYCFEGFLPRKGKLRRTRLEAMATDPRPTVIYESPHRVAVTLTDLTAAVGADRRVAVARELTKLHEEIWRGRLGVATEWITAQQPRGEYVLVVEGAPEPEPTTDAEIVTALDAELDAGTSRRDAAAAVAARLGLSRRRVYELLP